MRGKLIVIEGTDCSGKETQSKLLSDRLNKMGIETKIISFPVYDSPTGRIFGACYLGKEEMCDKYLNGEYGWFMEGASKVNPMVASLYAAADRKYNIDKINELLASGVNIIMDRYIYSNMAHQACKILAKEERESFIKKLEMLEFDILELPRPDITMLLYVPVSVSVELKKRRVEKGDQHENDLDYLKRAEEVYLHLKDRYDFNLLECVNEDKMRTIEDINDELLNEVLELLAKKEYSKCKRSI